MCVARRFLWFPTTLSQSPNPVSFASMQSVRIAKLFFQIISFVIFAYQSILAVNKFFSDGTIPTVETVGLSDAKLPVIVICTSDKPYWANDWIRQGYKTDGNEYNDFLQGLVDEEQDSVSWEGKNSLPYENLTYKVFHSLRTKMRLKITGNPPENWKFPVKNHNVVRGGLLEILTAFDGYCVKLDINTTHIDQLDIFDTQIIFNGKIRIFLADPGTSLFYKFNTDSMAGDSLENGMEDLFFLVNFEEIHWLEESGKCTNYGEGEEFKTFADCVENEQEKKFYPILGCQVPWLAAPDNPNICKGRIQLTEDNQTLVYRMISSVLSNIKEMRMADSSKTCLKPCQELRANVKFNYKISGTYETKTTMSFQKTVKVTRYLKAYRVSDLVVEAGSALGLWIGLSALGVFDLLLQAGEFVLKKFMKV